MPKHISTPWRTEGGWSSRHTIGGRRVLETFHTAILDRSEKRIVEIEGHSTLELDRILIDLERIVACVNACEGISDERLEAVNADKATMRVLEFRKISRAHSP